MRIRVSRRVLRRTGRILIISGLVIAVSLRVHALGRAVTPAPGESRLPVTYSPSVRRTEQYRRRAQAYLVDLAALDGWLTWSKTLLERCSVGLYFEPWSQLSSARFNRLSKDGFGCLKV